MKRETGIGIVIELHVLTFYKGEMMSLKPRTLF